ncbi:hypothetical protein D3C76_1846020 [compost metagenome]
MKVDFRAGKHSCNLGVEVQFYVTGVVGIDGDVLTDPQKDRYSYGYSLPSFELL